MAGQTWTYATTMAWAPHLYVVRARTPNKVGYDQLWHDVWDHGFRARFGRIVRRYLQVDGWRYFSCDASTCECPSMGWWGTGCVINAALVDDPPPAEPAQLQLEVE